MERRSSSPAPGAAPTERSHRCAGTLRSVGICRSDLSGAGVLQERCAGQLVAHRLVFSYCGYAAEPRFANIEPMEQSPAATDVSSGSSTCHGVAHLISRGDLLLLDKFEGAGYSYERIEVKMKPYEKDKKVILDWKKTTQDLNNSEMLPEHDPRRVRCRSLIARNPVCRLADTSRYWLTGSG